MVFLLLSMVFGSAFAAEDAPALLVRAANGYTVPYDSSPEKSSGCVVSMDKPTAVKIVAETETHFKVEWVEPIKGCLWQTAFRGLDLKSGFIRKADLILPEPKEAPKAAEATKEPEPKPVAEAPVIKPTPAEIGDCKDPVVQTLDPDVTAGMTSIFRILESDDAQNNGFKQIGHLEKYHRCLLTGKKNQYDNYVTRYREIIEDASSAFGLPMALLTCSCGRESLFDAKATSHTNVKGICQNVGASLQDVNRWISIKGSKVQERWKRFLSLLGNKIESKSCLTAGLSQQAVERCPSLGLGAAAVYYSYLYKEATEEESIGSASWDSKSLDTLITLAAANNVGPARVKSLRGKKKDKWAKALLAETCQKDGLGKFKEVKAHMLALHSCLIDGSWLDHQGKPLGGECARNNDPVSVAKQQGARAAFAGRLLNSCEGESVQEAPRASASAKAAKRQPPKRKAKRK